MTHEEAIKSLRTVIQDINDPLTSEVEIYPVIEFLEDQEKETKLLKNDVSELKKENVRLTEKLCKRIQDIKTTVCENCETRRTLIEIEDVMKNCSAHFLMKQMDEEEYFD